MSRGIRSKLETLILVSVFGKCLQDTARLLGSLPQGYTSRSRILRGAIVFVFGVWSPVSLSPAQR